MGFNTCESAFHICTMPPANTDIANRAQGYPSANSGALIPIRQHSWSPKTTLLSPAFTSLRDSVHQPGSIWLICLIIHVVDGNLVPPPSLCPPFILLPPVHTYAHFQPCHVKPGHHCCHPLVTVVMINYTLMYEVVAPKCIQNYVFMLLTHYD
jgi:hypothetical protein